jgi:hypothetical protein
MTNVTSHRPMTIASLLGRLVLVLPLLAGCVQSDEPVLGGGTQAFGPTLRLQLYGMRDGRAADPERVLYRWDNGVYRHAAGGMRDVPAFSVHAADNGDYVLQTVPAKPGNPVEYALAHKLVDGVWQVFPVDEADTDEATRAANCTSRQSVCTVATPEQLMTFVRATAARPHANGGLAIRLPDESVKRRR